ncbi:CPBP family glutamic-type intramembrane protease [Streptomyces lydicus]|uniref:CPBP family glutamic-type intramembrane protease n=1 Tax=Streptomyces lydicus TaxID=47763 RepID=UPI0013E9848A|nr:CPBP family glutamic-type intramembrane protease [Streptomyces lydicus]MCZ1011888.1 CPBP family glutamic-type intramembrane protease [Streptomyces lydicus]
MATQALRDAFVFVPGFVPWNGESPSRFFTLVGAGAVLGAMAVAVCVGNTSVRAAAGRFADGLGLWPASMRQALRWAAVGLAAAAALWAMADLVSYLPGLTSVPAAEDPRDVAVAQTSTLIRFGYGLIAPAPLEELLFRGPLLALWLALLAAQRRGSWMARRWVRWWLTGAATTASAILFAAGHTLGGSVNVAHAAACAVTTTAVTLWQRSLAPAVAAHGLYDACAFAWQ